MLGFEVLVQGFFGYHLGKGGCEWCSIGAPALLRSLSDVKVEAAQLRGVCSRMFAFGEVGDVGKDPQVSHPLT